MSSRVEKQKDARGLMNVFILTEAGQKVGFGHLSRCTAIYHAFVRRGIKPLMIVNGDEGIGDFLKGVRHEVFDWLGSFQDLLSSIAAADIVFIDSYLTPQRMYEDIAATVSLVACIDDYKRIRYPQGVVVNGLIYAPQMNYPKSADVEYLLGIRYALLRKAFWSVPARKTSPDLKNIFMTFGGSDFLNLAPDTLKAVVEQYPDAKKTIVISRFYKKLKEIETAADKNTQIVLDATDEKIKRLMLASDAAISASGQTLSELAVLGIPGVAFYVADNQLRNWKSWAAKGFIAAGARVDEIIEGLRQLEPAAIRQRNSRRLQKTISSNGTFKIVDALIKKAAEQKQKRKRAGNKLGIRRIKNGDCRDIWLWRNTMFARRASFNPESIPYESHEQWFRGKMNDRKSFLWIVQSGKEKIGYVRHDIDGDKAVNSVLLNPQYYGMGVGAAVIRKADEHYVKTKGVPPTICAEIQDHHAASIKAFRTAGYRLTHPIVKNGKKAGVYQWQG